MGALGEGVEQPLHLLVEERVVGDVLCIGGEALGRRQFAMEEQVGDLEERGMLGQVFDAVPAVPQFSGAAVYV